MFQWNANCWNFEVIKSTKHQENVLENFKLKYQNPVNIKENIMSHSSATRKVARKKVVRKNQMSIITYRRSGESHDLGSSEDGGLKHPINSFSTGWCSNGNFIKLLKWLDLLQFAVKSVMSAVNFLLLSALGNRQGETLTFPP